MFSEMNEKEEFISSPVFFALSVYVWIFISAYCFYVFVYVLNIDQSIPDFPTWHQSLPLKIPKFIYAWRSIESL